MQGTATLCPHCPKDAPLPAYHSDALLLPSHTTSPSSPSLKLLLANINEMFCPIDEKKVTYVAIEHISRSLLKTRTALHAEPTFKKMPVYVNISMMQKGKYFSGGYFYHQLGGYEYMVQGKVYAITTEPEWSKTPKTMRK